MDDWSMELFGEQTSVKSFDDISHHFESDETEATSGLHNSALRQNENMIQAWVQID